MAPSYPASTMPQPMFPPPSLPSSYQQSAHAPPGHGTATAGPPSLPPISPISHPQHQHHPHPHHPPHHHHGGYDQYSPTQRSPSSSQYPPQLPHPAAQPAHHPPPANHHMHPHHSHAQPPLQQPPPLSHAPGPEAQPDPPPPAPAVVPSSKPSNGQVVLASISKVDENTGWKYQLDVVQQPRRARMCGFGDKDRRPITPPPCVRLIVTDPATGKEINCNDIDHAMFVLNVDLWSEDGTREVNLVRSSSSSASSAAQNTTSPTEPAPDASMSHYSMAHPAAANREPAYGQHAPGYPQDYPVQHGYSVGHGGYATAGGYPPSQQYLPYNQAYHQDPSALSHPRSGSTSSATQTRGMFTRNLIGSVAVSAFRLNNTAEEPGVWFVLQDLSVRTEGSFRLRFSFVDVSPRGAQPADGSVPKINTGRAPTLASCFSEPFHVYSAKKFPGVCESTPLSKTFAGQGIKIPIRKDTTGKDEEEDAYMD